ncbi:L-threo-3-hydroxyaspartate ammonia-lyase [Frankia sp. Hr75.2]|nr:L-threo-3-hydroxyaspartate ammonia-lyase [Frankia sp. Hr75.2]
MTTPPVPTTEQAVALDHVRAAAARLAAVAVITPVMRAPVLDDQTGGHVLIKCENLQRTGSFKFRGAYNALACLPAEQLARGVIAFSSGNHALAVATAAAMLNTTALIVMPADAPPTKLAAVKHLGATVVTFDRYTDDRFTLTNRLAAEHGLTLIPPYDHHDVIAGAATTTLQLLEQTGPLDVLVLPLGGGGQLAGAGVVTAALAPSTRLIGVETATGDKNRQSLQAGRRVRIPVPRTIADGVTGEIPGELTFPLIQRHVDEILVVDDEEITAALAVVFDQLKLVVEPSGALAAAAVLAGRVNAPGQRTAVVLSGGNIDLARLHTLLHPRPLN